VPDPESYVAEPLGTDSISADAVADDLDFIGDQASTDQMRLEHPLDVRGKGVETLSNALDRTSESQGAMLPNLKGSDSDPGVDGGYAVGEPPTITAVDPDALDALSDDDELGGFELQTAMSDYAQAEAQAQSAQQRHDDTAHDIAGSVAGGGGGGGATPSGGAGGSAPPTDVDDVDAVDAGALDQLDAAVAPADAAVLVEADATDAPLEETTDDVDFGVDAGALAEVPPPDAATPDESPQPEVALDEPPTFDAAVLAEPAPDDPPPDDGGYATVADLDSSFADLFDD
jgi:hypothetical protein